MKKSIFVIFALILFSNVLANEVDYKNITKIETPTPKIKEYEPTILAKI